MAEIYTVVQFLADFIRDSFQINRQYYTRTDWRAIWRKNKRTMLTYVSTATLSLQRLPIPVCPPKPNRRL